jgi:hypothetical protein
MKLLTVRLWHLFKMARSQNYVGLLNEQTSSVKTSIFTVIIQFERKLGENKKIYNLFNMFFRVLL